MTSDDEIDATTEFDDVASEKQHVVLWIKDVINENLSIGEAIGDGEAILLLPNIATPRECSSLFTDGLDACERCKTPSLSSLWVLEQLFPTASHQKILIVEYNIQPA